MTRVSPCRGSGGTLDVPFLFLTLSREIAMSFQRHDPVGPRRVFNAHNRRSLALLEQDRIRLRFAAIEPIQGLPPLASGRIRLRRKSRKTRLRRRAKPRSC